MGADLAYQLYARSACDRKRAAAAALAACGAMQVLHGVAFVSSSDCVDNGVSWATRGDSAMTSAATLWLHGST